MFIQIKTVKGEINITFKNLCQMISNDYEPKIKKKLF